MIDLMQRMLYTGVGLASLTRDKIAELSEEVARQADLTEGQAKKFQDDLLKKGEEARAQFESQIDQRLEGTLKTLKLVRQEQYDTLLRRVETLEQQVQALQSAGRLD